MHEYLKATEYAYKNLFLLHRTHINQLKDYQSLFDSEFEKLKIFERDFITSDKSEDFSEIEVNSKFSKYASSASNCSKIKDNIQKLSEAIEIKKYANAVIGAAILEIAKKAVDIRTLGKYSSEVRKIHGLCLTQIIKHGRNQAVHYDNLHNPHTIQLFKELENNLGDKFSLEKNSKTNLSTEIIELLGWSSDTDFLMDMKIILDDRVVI